MKGLLSRYGADKLSEVDPAKYGELKTEAEVLGDGYDEGQSKLKGNGKSVPALSALKTPLKDGDILFLTMRISRCLPLIL